MKRILVGCLLLPALLGCESAELTPGGMLVRAVNDAPSGCQLVATVREKEGGGMRSLDHNRAIVDTRLRNEAARRGGNALAVVAVVRGDTDEGALDFTTGVPGLATPSPRCTNCVAVTARIFQCEGAGRGAPLVSPDPPQSGGVSPASRLPAGPAPTQED